MFLYITDVVILLHMYYNTLIINRNNEQTLLHTNWQNKYVLLWYCSSVYDKFSCETSSSKYDFRFS